MDFTKEYENEKLLKVYGGANGGKTGVRINGKNYMLKFAPANKFLEDASYTNSCIVEDIGCKILKTFGMDSQNTMLGTVIKNGKKKVCVACEDFETNGFRLYEFSKIKNDDIDTSSNGMNTELEEILSTIENQRFLPPEQVTRYFWNLFVADALLGNFDRHNGNWGFLLNDDLGIAKLSPVYDCGSCLYAGANEEKMLEVLNSRQEIDNRIYVVPRSAIKLKSKKVDYYKFLTTTDNLDCLEAIEAITSKIDLTKINEIIEQTPLISDTAKIFYKTMLKHRYEKILLPAFARVKEHFDFKKEKQKNKNI